MKNSQQAEPKTRKQREGKESKRFSGRKNKESRWRVTVVKNTKEKNRK